MSAWISHVKAYAAKHKVSYKQAMSQAKASYKGKGSSSAKAAPVEKKGKGKKLKAEKGTAELGGKTIHFKKGGLHKSLKVSPDYTFKKSELRKLNKLPVGEKFDFKGNDIKMTSRIKKQLTLGLNLMK